MDLQIKDLTLSLSLLNINEKYVIKIQKWYRGSIFRLKRLPLILYIIKKYLKEQEIKYSFESEDGRFNSYIDENKVIDMLIKRFSNKIIKPKSRMWYDILAYDYLYGWIPINIKITTTRTNDNVSNLTSCVYAYTDEILDIFSNKLYFNGKMSIILFNKLKNKEYNKLHKKDYYFIVLNKTNTKNIIINSIKGLTFLTPNINNLPFQICWNNNKKFEYGNINIKINQFVDCINKTNLSWKETFITNMKTL